MHAPKTEPSRKTLRDLRRGQILSMARALVAEAGLEALTISTLEKRCAFSRGVITYHFANKDEIVAAVLDSAIDEIQEATRAQLKAEDDYAARVRVMLHSTLQGFLRHPEAVHILLSFWGRIPRDEWATRANAKLYAGYREGAGALIEAGIEAGQLRADVDVSAIAVLSVGLVIGIATQVYFEPGATDPEAAMEVAATALVARMTA